MEFDQRFSDKFSCLSQLFPEHTTSINANVPIMVPLQQTSTLVPPPLNNTFLNHHDVLHHFQHHQSLNGANHDPNFVIEANPSSSICPFSLIPTLSSSDPCTNWSPRDLVNSYYTMEYAPNNNKMEVMHGSHNNLLEFFKEIPIQRLSSHPQVGSSLPPLPLVYPSVVMKNKLQDELSCITGARNGFEGTDLKAVVAGDNEQKKKVQRKRTKIAYKFTNRNKGQWTPDEDRVLIQSVNHFGLTKWSQIAKSLNGRVGKQCRQRWINHLQPNIKKDSWTEEEDIILIEAHKEVGNKWTEIAKRLPNRTENTVKNHWNATKRRLNAKVRRNNRINSKGALLQSYIMQVTTAEAENNLRESMGKMNLRNEDRIDLGLLPAWFESSTGNFNTKNWVTQVYGHENDDVGGKLQTHVPKINGNGGFV